MSHRHIASVWPGPKYIFSIWKVGRMYLGVKGLKRHGPLKREFPPPPLPPPPSPCGLTWRKWSVSETKTARKCWACGRAAGARQTAPTSPPPPLPVSLSSPLTRATRNTGCTRPLRHLHCPFPPQVCLSLTWWHPPSGLKPRRLLRLILPLGGWLVRIRPS